MASILILEDGTGIVDANSYINAATAREYASLRGSALPAAPATGADPVETSLILAAEYLDSLAFVGVQAASAQALAWPRVFTSPVRGYNYICDSSIAILDTPIDPSYYVLPQKIKDAQAQLVIENLLNGVDFMPTIKGGTQFITREKVDVIETTYSERLGTLDTPTMRRVNAKLREFLIQGGGFNALRATRA